MLRRVSMVVAVKGAAAAGRDHKADAAAKNQPDGEESE
jgi:hypothetical protein